jgi:hypothetical protein
MKDSLETQILNSRIYESFPITQPAFAKLLGLLDIQASREISSAAVSLGARSRLLINPDFVEQKCKTNFDLTMLVLHELYHVVLGHTRLYERATALHNWAFDAVINAQLSQLFPEVSQTALFRRCYRADVFPECLLRPPEGWRTGNEKWHLQGKAGDVHRSLYTEDSTSYEELFRLLLNLCTEDQSTYGIDGLLGNHELDSETCDSDLLREIRGIIAEWPMVEERSGRDQGSSLTQRTLLLHRKHNAAVSILRKALFRLAGMNIDGTLTPKVSFQTSASVLPYRSMIDRRSEVTSAMGHDPFFFQAQTQSTSLTRSERVHVYLDVSGSMDGVIRALYEAIIPLLGSVAPKIFLFSTDISEIDHSQIKKGVLDTTGGTSIDVVTKHILKRQVKKALIVTDGWVGDIPSSHVEKLNKQRVKVHGVITKDGDVDFLAPINGKAWKLPQLTND